VGSIMLGGSKRFAVRIWLNADKMAARNITLKDVTDALEDNNIDAPSGRIEGKFREFTIKTEGQLTSVEAFNDFIVLYENGAPIRLKDIAVVKEGVENERTLARFNQKPAVGLGVLKQTKANTVSVADGIKEKLQEIRGALPPSIRINVAYDSSIFVKQSINEVTQTLFIAGILVVLVIFLFLRHLSITLIPAVTIPISIITPFAFMYFFGFSINNFTLLALVLSIGIVVDDSIVMLENIYRHMEEGKSRLQAAHDGSSEIAFAVIATTLTLIAVFIPVAFMKGQIGRFFYEFGIAVAIAVSASSFVALTLTPMLSSKFIKIKEKRHKLYDTLENAYGWIEKKYTHAIHFVLQHKLWVCSAALLIFLVGSSLFFVLGKEFIPGEDRGSFMILYDAPEGSTLEYTNKYAKELENILASKQEIKSFFCAIALGGRSNVNSGIFFVRLHERSSRRHMKFLFQDLRREFSAVVGVNAFPLTFNPLVRRRAQEFEYILKHPDLETLEAYSLKFKDALQETPGFIDVDTDLEFNKPELNVSINRDKAAQADVSVRDIAETLNTFLSGNDYTKYKARGERYDVMLQLERKDRLTKDVLQKIYIKGRDDQLFSLRNLIDVKEGAA